jgi:hypothetical protein
MSTYNFHLADLANARTGVWGQGTLYAIGLYMQEFFDAVCADPNTPYSNSDFWWNTSPGRVLAHEVVIYFVDNKGESLLKKLGSSGGLGSTGTTRINASANLSEVYVAESVAAMGGGSDIARGFAVLAFHEAMHNKLKLDNKLHSVGGGGLAAATVFANTKITPQNVAKMAPALSRAVPQETKFLAGLPQSST